MMENIDIFASPERATRRLTLEEQLKADGFDLDGEFFRIPNRDGYFHWSGVYFTRSVYERAGPEILMRKIDQAIASLSDPVARKAQLKKYKRACQFCRDLWEWLYEKAGLQEYPYGIISGSEAERRMRLLVRDYHPLYSLKPGDLIGEAEVMRAPCADAQRVIEEWEELFAVKIEEQLNEFCQKL